jgi:hypothetical protein
MNDDDVTEIKLCQTPPLSGSTSTSTDLTPFDLLEHIISHPNILRAASALSQMQATFIFSDLEFATTATTKSPTVGTPQI